jgi:hypothetical protein
MTIKKLWTPGIVIPIVVIIAIAVIWFKSGNANTPPVVPLHQQELPAITTPQIPQEEIALNAIESYLYLSVLQTFELAKQAGTGSQEYRDYELKYSEYRTFRDNRVKQMTERNIR